MNRNYKFSPSAGGSRRLTLAPAVGDDSKRYKLLHPTEVAPGSAMNGVAAYVPAIALFCSTPPQRAGSPLVLPPCCQELPACWCPLHPAPECWWAGCHPAVPANPWHSSPVPDNVALVLGLNGHGRTAAAVNYPLQLSALGRSHTG